jgi:hypothetical protein
LNEVGVSYCFGGDLAVVNVAGQLHFSGDSMRNQMCPYVSPDSDTASSVRPSIDVVFDSRVGSTSKSVDRLDSLYIAVPTSMLSPSTGQVGPLPWLKA